MLIENLSNLAPVILTPLINVYACSYLELLLFGILIVCTYTDMTRSVKSMQPTLDTRIPHTEMDSSQYHGWFNSSYVTLQLYELWPCYSVPIIYYFYHIIHFVFNAKYHNKGFVYMQLFCMHDTVCTNL